MISAAILEKLPPSWTHTVGDRGAAGQIDPMGLGDIRAKCLAFFKNSQILPIFQVYRLHYQGFSIRLIWVLHGTTI